MPYRNNYANFKEIKTQTITMDQKDREGQSKKAKLFIRLDKHAQFDENYANFEKIRAENDAKKKEAEVTKQWENVALSTRCYALMPKWTKTFEESS